MLLIDTYNVLHVTGVLPPELSGLEVADLAKLVQAGRHSGHEIILVCDGTGAGSSKHGIDPKRSSGGSGVKRTRHGREGRRGTVAVVYAGPGMEADSLIEMMLRGGGRFGNASAGRQGKAIVVSSDRRVRYAAKRAGARSVGSEEFLHQLVDDYRRHRTGTLRSSPGSDDRPAFARRTPLDQYTVEEWMREFGYDVPTDPQGEWDSLSDELASQPGASNTGERNSPGGDSTPPTANPNRTPGADSSPTHTPAPNPLIRAAMQEWPGRVKSDDLDMEKWLEGDPRLGP